MNTQQTETQTTDLYFLDALDSEGTFINPNVNVTRLDRYDFIGAETHSAFKDWDISDAYSWN